jgi:hypothetical protein
MPINGGENELEIEVPSMGTRFVPTMAIGNLTYVSMLRTPVRLHVSYGESPVLIPASGMKLHLRSGSPQVLYGVEMEISTLSEDDLPKRLMGVIFITTKDVAICAADDFKRPDFAWPVPPRGKADLSSDSRGVFDAIRLRTKGIRNC